MSAKTIKAKAANQTTNFKTSLLIELHSVTRQYGYGESATFALKDFSLQVHRGEFIIIMGPSGCGKSTLLNIIGLLDRPTSGTYFLSNTPVSRLSSRKKSHIRARNIGYIFQNFNLIPDLPIIENVALPLIYSGMGKTRRLKAAAAILETFHLEKREYFYPYQLSGGQQQRVCIARSLVNHPEIILADEPTGNLDSRSSHIVMEELRKIHSEGHTIIMVTHNPNLTTYATRVIHMLDGGIDVDIKTVSDEDLPQIEDPVEETLAKEPVEEPIEELTEKPLDEPIKTQIETQPTTLATAQTKSHKTNTTSRTPLSSNATFSIPTPDISQSRHATNIPPHLDSTPPSKPSPLGEIIDEPVRHHSSFPIVGSEFHDRSVRTSIKPTIEDLILETKTKPKTKGKK